MRVRGKRWGLERARGRGMKQYSPLYLGLGWWGDVEGSHCEGSAELESALRRKVKTHHCFYIHFFCSLEYHLLFLFTSTTLTLLFLSCKQETVYLCQIAWIENIPLLTRATLENIVRLQLKRHDHAVKPTQLSSRYQHSAEDVIRVS